MRPYTKPVSRPCTTTFKPIDPIRPWSRRRPAACLGHLDPNAPRAPGALTRGLEGVGPPIGAQRENSSQPSLNIVRKKSFTACVACSVATGS
jgi:hypothetical protein